MTHEILILLVRKDMDVTGLSSGSPLLRNLAVTYDNTCKLKPT